MNYKKKKDRKNIILITVAALAMVVTTAVWLLCFTGDNQGYRTISVVDISGTVSVVKDDIEYSAYPGMVLQEGHEIVTAANSYVRLVLDDDKYVKLEPGSKMVFDTLGLLGSNKTKLNLERGSMTSEIVKPLENDAEYVVVAPNAVLSVRGTFFRVDLGVGKDGQINADVMTYGGSVASQRIMPTGEVVEEEVLIDAGFKTSINMDTEETVYVMQAVEGAIDTTGDGVVNLAPIVKTDIPDDDMVDIYFASENGHELFVSAEEVKEDIEMRGINLEEQTSVYDKAEVILAEQKKDVNSQLSMTDVSVFADDNVPLARVEEVVEDESVSEGTSASETASENGSEGSTASNVTQGMLTDGAGKETVKEHVHTSVMGGTEGVHRQCSECKEVLSTAHSFSKKETLAATCETAGENTFTCLCGYSYTEEIEATGHIAENGGVAGIHTQCSICDAVLGTTHTYSEEITVAAGCSEVGEKKYSCSCGYSYTETIAATGHSGVAGDSCATVCGHCGRTLSVDHNYQGTVTTAATCNNIGVMTYTCQCGSSYTEEIAALGHDYAEEFTVDTEATCTTAGSQSKHCSRCESVAEVTEIPATDHSYGAWTTTLAATCEAAGEQSHTCGVCGAVETETLDVLGHDYAETFTVDTEATCTTAGSQSKHCSRCESVAEVTEIPATGHSYGAWTTTLAATCEAAGEQSHTCGVCGAVETETLDVLGHDYAETFTVDTEATCTTAGSQSKHCSRCESVAEVTEIPATGHSYGAWTTTLEATCEAAGEQSHSCGICGAVETETLDVLGHDYAEAFTVDTEATCTTAGSHSKHCSRCESSAEVTEIPATGHSYGEWTTTLEATCEAAGEQSHSCGICGAVETEALDVLGHDYAEEFTVDTEATCTTAGSQSKHCSRCESVAEVTEIPATGHSYTEEVTVEATCTEKGVRTYTCHCNDSYTEEIEMLSHTETYGSEADAHTKCSVCGTVMSNGESHEYTDEVTVEATCTTVGERTYSCACGYSYTEEIEMLSHTETYGSETDVHTKCSVCSTVLSDGESHEYTDEVTVEATCTTVGERTYSCACGYSYTEEIEMLPHTETYGSEADVHTKCSVCGTVLSDGESHEYTDEVTVEATCTTVGERTYSCACGYSYTEEIEMLSHTETYGSEADVHTKCSVCGTVLSDGEGHEYTDEVTVEATCTTAGERTYTCACSYSYTEEIEALGHEGTGDGSTTCEHCGDAMLELNATNFPDAVFLEYVKTEFNTVTSDDEILVGEEVSALTSCTEIDVSGTQDSGGVSGDGGISDLTGIEYFTALTTLDCSYNSGLTGIPTSTLANLTILNIANCTSVSAIDLSTCSNLTSLTAEGCTSLKTIDASGCPELTFLDADYSGVEIVNVNGCTKIATFDDLELYLTNSLVELYAQGVPAISGSGLSFDGRSTLEVIDFSGCTDMTTLDLSNCPALKTVNLSGCTNLATLNLTDSTAITDLNISGTKLTGLDVSGCADLATLTPATGLTSLDISGCTSLTTLDTTSLTALTILNISDSGLESVSLASNTSLETLIAQNSSLAKLEGDSGIGETALVTLDLSGSEALTSLVLVGDFENVATIDVSNCTALTNLYFNTQHDSATSALTSLNYDGCTALESFFLNVFGGDLSFTGEMSMANYPALKSFNVGSAPGITSIDVTSNTNLETFSIGNTAITSIDVSNCAGLKEFCIDECSGITGIDLSANKELIVIAITNCPQIKELEVDGCTSLVEVALAESALETVTLNNVTNLEMFRYEHTDSPLTALTITGTSALTSLELQYCAALETLDVTDCSALTGLNTDFCPALTTLVADNSGLTSLDVTACANITSISVADCTVLAEINASGCTSLTELVLASATNLTSLDVSNCTALTNLDISTLVNLEVFQACSAGITMLSNDSTCLNFSYNPKLKEIYVNDLTSFTEINLTANTELEKFFYDLMPMTTIDLSNCVSLQNFQTGGSNVTSLDFSNCPDIFRIINHSSSALTAINVSGCTKLCDLSLLSSNNVSSVDITNAGTEVEVGAYVADKYLVFTTTAGSTTETTLQEAEGWNDSIMYMSNERL